VKLPEMSDPGPENSAPLGLVSFDDKAGRQQLNRRCVMSLVHRGCYRALTFVLLLASTTMGHAAFAADSASEFIVEFGQETLTTMANNAISPTDRVQHFAVIIDRDFDVPRIAQSMLGRYWQTATDSERSDFKSVLRDYMVRTYSEHLRRYRGDSFRVIDQRTVSVTATIVRSNITRIATGQPMTLEWLVIKSPQGFRVSDLIVGGVSLVIAQQQEFASLLRLDGGRVSILTALIRSKVGQLEAARK
jgi:phospholipid transport system substrate-binding protein